MLQDSFKCYSELMLKESAPAILEEQPLMLKQWLIGIYCSSLQHEKACMRSILVDARPCNEPSAVADGAASVSELTRLSSRLRKPFVQARDYFADIG
ncbi:hypothetical protein T03_10400 [Trichinella britovi]|uniref:Uncharacterized protein n=1 Tax=Trichinella britovi TaxID=45882 RepID=A0A0V1CAY7_TRIBR|nr:hypothetical protein T03_10400 [Trichinella britovi]